MVDEILFKIRGGDVMISSVGISLSRNSRVYQFDPNHLELKKGDSVVVETARGIQFGTVMGDIKQVDEKNVVLPLKKVLRYASKEDILQHEKNEKEEQKALQDAKRISATLNLSMHFIDASFTLDRTQLLLNYVAEERIDFRELAKKLAQIYRTRIELHQIGVRDKAKLVGGIGPCGRFLCCNSFLTNFDSVSINMAKNQYLSLNPTKINGVCGRLLCCLNYEDDVYRELRKGMPDLGSQMPTEEGLGKVVSVDLFHRTYQVELKNKSILEIKVDA